MRDTFALSFFGDASFFSGANAAVAIDLNAFRAPGFTLLTDANHSAYLKEITFKLAQNHGPTFHVRSKDVLSTLDLNQLRPKLASAVEIKSAVVSICYGTGKRPKRVTLAKKNSMSFSRATQASETTGYMTAPRLRSAHRRPDRRRCVRPRMGAHRRQDSRRIPRPPRESQR
jgi:hypothetical protein